mmetsp:Transcript_109556/g.153352  ORF Transcript_109556/g.153352 Transcript_109556/m.153352 type:complete len:208 (+) Transcript_109556:23-646(+)
MQIFVSSQPPITLSVQPSDSVESVKAVIESRQGVPAEEQRLVFGGKVLEDGRSLADYNVEQESTLQFGLTLRGGHCQVPCGIFDDPKLVAEIREACATIRKAMVQINELSGNMSAQNFNQMTRWVNTKEEHCGKIIESIGQYCLCQRVKPFGAAGTPFKSSEDYIAALTAHHGVMIAAMKAKQTVDVGGADALDAAVAEFAKMYVPA